MIMVAGDIARILTEDVAGLMAERVPDRRPASVIPDSTFDLVGRGRRAPEKSVGEAFRHCATRANNSLIIICDIDSPGFTSGNSIHGQSSELGLVGDRRRNVAEPRVRVPARYP